MKTLYPQIVAASLTCLSFLFSIWLVLKERYYLLPSVPTRGHGLVLLVFWTLVFINENLSLINLKKEQWWIHVSSSFRDQVEMSLFVARYTSSLLIFVLGLKAPGIAADREDEYIHLTNDGNAVNALQFHSKAFEIIFFLFKTGEPFNMDKWMEKTTNFSTIFMAKEKYLVTTTRHLLHWIVVWWTCDKRFGTGLQSKNC